MDGSAELFDCFMDKLESITKDQLFFASMATDINNNSVPIGLFNQFKLEKIKEKNKDKHKYLNLKKRGVVIINDIVRLYSLNHAIRASNTLERLNALAKISHINKTDIYDLKDCWRYLTQLRLRTQINQEGLRSNCINPNKLTSMEKHQLKEALNLEKCRHRYNLPDYSNHNALTDAMATAELFLAQINHISSGKPLAVKSLL